MTTFRVECTPRTPLALQDPDVMQHIMRRTGSKLEWATRLDIDYCMAILAPLLFHATTKVASQWRHTIGQAGVAIDPGVSLCGPVAFLCGTIGLGPSMVRAELELSARGWHGAYALTSVSLVF